MAACAMLESVEPDATGARPDMRSDTDLLAAVAGGERDEPLRELYRRYAGRIYGLGVQLLGDRGLAEELVQETFVRLWRNAGRYDPARGSPGAFIFTIARRLAVDLWRRPSSRPAEAAPAPPPADDQVDRLVVRLGVRDALDSLSEAHRQVLELSYRGELKQTDIAQKLGIPVGTVKTRSYHALRALKAALEARDIHG
ncbi:MAG TPA: sigma-70 family RNA polymerase sigma factor [Acidimicrobiales bacterium]|nr:sigma-70 family RNA polymerase sigma factor [Acidimicrobiales bacterium]